MVSPIDITFFFSRTSLIRRTLNTSVSTSKRKAQKMASVFAFLGTSTIVVMITIANPASAAQEFKVGDAQGWRQPGLNETEMYNQWTFGKKIHVGDSLRFQYENDSVLVVDKWGYYHCDTSNPSVVFNDGNTVITLDDAGAMYFVSGDPHHCEHGQRLLINVMPLRSISKPPPAAVASPPQPPQFASSPAPSPLSSSGAERGLLAATTALALVACAFWVSVSHFSS